ncbi:MAG TPA: RimK family alpha-L-glutamate ligase [Methylovirgula sp.]|nr:RimK family alpha-L-glutamate ligase [Methylovirgula sp.]
MLLSAKAASSSGPQIALFIDKVEWHARELTRAFAALGARIVPLRLSACSFDTRRSSGIAIPGFGARLPDLVLVRAVGLGSFESITLRLGILHALTELGVPIANTPRAIERCVDKSTTSFLCFHNKIPTPETFALQSPRQARALVRRECARGPLVLKPLFGAQGRGLKLIRHEDDLPDIELLAGVYYLQRFVGIDRGGYSDIRVLVAQGRVIAAMTRRADHWITNVKLGARPEPVQIDDEMRDLALRATAAVDADFAGVDLLRGADGRLTVIEVNSMPGWQGLQSVTDLSIAEELAAALLARYGLMSTPAELAS